MTTDPFNKATYCATEATAECNRIARCNPNEIAYSWGSTQGCIDFQTAACNAGNGSVLSSLVGVVTSFSASAQAACINATNAAACDEEPGLLPACQGVFTGSRPQGASCFGNLHCQPSLFCSGTSETQACGTCQPRAALNATCQSFGCVSGAYCDIPDGATQGTCRSQDAALVRAGQACNGQTGPFCRGVAGCKPNNPASTTDFSGVCTTVTTLTAGAACDVNNPYNACGTEQECVYNTDATQAAPTPPGTCTARRTTGQACNFLRNQVLCTGNTFCSAWEETTAAGTCVARRPVGGACNDPELSGMFSDGTPFDYTFMVCAENLLCDGAQCIAPPAVTIPTCP